MKVLILFFLVNLSIYQLIDCQILTDKDCDCRLPVSNRIVGGREAKLRIPFQVSLSKNGKHFCGIYMIWQSDHY